MSEHTPGPWRSDDDNPLLILDGNGTSVAMLIRGYTSTECELNRRLIAAAPETAAERDKLKEVNAEMLAALKRVDQSWTEWLPCGPYDESLTTGPIVRIYESTISIWKQIRAAIAKAEGKS